MKSKYNFVVIGKSGVGKSSLINYFFNKEVAKTGAGAPVTEKKFELYKSEEVGQILQVYDSWGIEGGKTAEWLDFFKGFMNERKGIDVSKWINTAIYCISGESNRIEDYDKKIVKVLVDEELSPIIVVTKSDADSSGRFIESVKKEFPTLDVIAITSVKQSMGLGVNKKTVEPKGIELLKMAVFDNCLTTFSNRVNFVRKEILKMRRSEAPDKLNMAIRGYVYGFNSSDTISTTEFSKLTEDIVKQIEAYDLEVQKEIESIMRLASISFSNFKKNNLNEISTNYLAKERINREKDSLKREIMNIIVYQDFTNIKTSSWFSLFINPWKYLSKILTMNKGMKKEEIIIKLQDIIEQHYSKIE